MKSPTQYLSCFRSCTILSFRLPQCYAFLVRRSQFVLFFVSLGTSQFSFSLPADVGRTVNRSVGRLKQQQQNVRTLTKGEGLSEITRGIL